MILVKEIATISICSDDVSHGTFERANLELKHENTRKTEKGPRIVLHRKVRPLLDELIRENIDETSSREYVKHVNH